MNHVDVGLLRKLQLHHERADDPGADALEPFIKLHVTRWRTLLTRLVVERGDDP